MEFRSVQRRITNCGCSMPPPWSEEDKEDGSDLGPFSVEGPLERGGREPWSCCRGNVVAKGLTCTRGRVVNNDREALMLSIQMETLDT
jgi:hypothetical protein